MSYELQQAGDPTLLHPENFDFPFWGSFGDSMQDRLREVDDDTYNKEDPDVSVVIRTKNNVDALDELLDELDQQVFDGEVQVVVVDTESRDGTVQLARDYGATIVRIAQDGFSYPKALNRGFEAADHPYVYSLVGHSNLVSTHTLRAVTRWHDVPDFGGAYGVSLPNRNARIAEWAGEGLLFLVAKLRKQDYMGPAEPIEEIGLGTLASNCTVISREVWSELGGYDEAYGAGGEDGALAKEMMDNGLVVVREPALSVHHTHGLSPWQTYKQFREWQRLSQPLPFDETRLASYRPDLGLRDPERSS